MTAAAYESCGGLPVRAALEDEALERALRGQGVAIHRTRRVRVRPRPAPAGAPTGARAGPRPRRLACETHPPSEPSSRSTGCSRARQHDRAGAARPRSRPPDRTDRRTGRAAEGRRPPGRGPFSTPPPRTLLPDRPKSRAQGRAGGRAARRVRARAGQGRRDVARAGSGRQRDRRVRGHRHRGLPRTFIIGLLVPLVCDPEVQLVKGSSSGPSAWKPVRGGGGRVTELMARPLLNLHAPELAVFDQPLAGETAGRHDCSSGSRSAPATGWR